jgi:protein-tyrosine phosphatase
VAALSAGGELMRILFVCTGNICRSPSAEAVMRRLVDDAGLGGEFVLESAGTGRWHAGGKPDRRAVTAATARGYAVAGTARQVRPADFEAFDLLVGMDRGHVRRLRDLSPSIEARLKIRPLLEDEDVPDPYGGPAAEFEQALDVIERGCRALFEELTAAPF